MIGYASNTGTKRNLAALRREGWRIMISAKGGLQPKGFKYAIDNGAWNAFTSGTEFDEAAFIKAYALLADGADFVVLPDIVAGGMASLEFSVRWRERLGATPCPMMLAVQDGMTVADVQHLIGPDLGIFVGGTTEWKVATMAQWAGLARARGAKTHAGRVNTARRIKICHAAGVDSFDGSSVSRYAVTLPLLDNARRQGDLLVGL